MKYLFTVLLCSPFILVAQMGGKNFIDENYIEVTGKSEMQITPDLIYIQIKINERDKKDPIAVIERRMFDKFQEIGIDTKKDLSVNDFMSAYRNKIFGKDIVLSKEYQLVVHDAKMVSRVFQELEKLEISNASIDRVDHSKMEDYRREIKISAIKAAKEKADALTKAIGQSVGKAIYIQELENAPVYYSVSSNYRTLKSSQEHRGAPDDGLDVDFEKIKLEYSILTRFELK